MSELGLFYCASIVNLSRPVVLVGLNSLGTMYLFDPDTGAEKESMI